MRPAEKCTVRDWRNPTPANPLAPPQGSLPLAPTSVDTLVSSARTQPAWGWGGGAWRQSVMMLAVASRGPAAVGTRTSLQTVRAPLSGILTLWRSRPRLPSSLNCLSLGTGPRGPWALFLDICGSFFRPQDFRPCPELGKRDPEAPFSGSPPAPPKICPFCLAFSFLPVLLELAPSPHPQLSLQKALDCSSHTKPETEVQNPSWSHSESFLHLLLRTLPKGVSWPAPRGSPRPLSLGLFPLG